MVQLVEMGTACFVYGFNTLRIVIIVWVQFQM